MTWTTKSGRILDIDTMSSEHITNTINYLIKRYRKEEYIPEDTLEKVVYMRRVLAERIIKENDEEVLDDVDPINIFKII